MRPILRTLPVVVVLWALLVGAVIAFRPIVPIDETRYASVAWEMWTSHNFLVPHLNGEPYSDKPPLLFWLQTLGWAVFGVHDWVARVVGPLFGFLDLVLVAVLGRALWPEDETIGPRAALVLLAMPVFAVYGTMLMFDTLLVFFVLLANLGILRACRDGRWTGWLLAGASIGGGLLAKGPVVFLFVLPVGLAAPWWSAEARAAWKLTYLRLFAAVAGGIAIALAWAIPAAMAGGPEYREAILWGQTAGRVTQSFAHRRPFWLYLVLLPVVLFPWAYWPPVWRGLKRSDARGLGFRFCAVWVCAAFVLLSCVSGKQVHYLLPLLPAVALLTARGLAQAFAEERVQRPMTLGVLYAVLGAGVLVTPLVAHRIFALHEPLSLPPLLWLIAPLAGVLLFSVKPSGRPGSVAWMAATSTVIVLIGASAAMRQATSSLFDMAPIGQRIASLEDAGVPVVHAAPYQGQYQFAGRLEAPLPEVNRDDAVAQWCHAHPNGYVVRYWRDELNPACDTALLTRRYRTRDSVGLVPARDYLAGSSSASVPVFAYPHTMGP